MSLPFPHTHTHTHKTKIKRIIKIIKPRYTIEKTKGEKRKPRRKK
jgi:hypothetical protein